MKYIGEFHLNEPRGCGKAKHANGDTQWGEHKNEMKEGYITMEGASGIRYIG